MVYFVARVAPFVAKGGPVLLTKDGILPVAEIGILYLTIYMWRKQSGQSGKINNLAALKMVKKPVATAEKMWYHFIIPVEYVYSTK